MVDIIDRDIVEESPTKEDSEILTRDIKKKGESVLEYTVRQGGSKKGIFDTGSHFEAN